MENFQQRLTPQEFDRYEVNDISNMVVILMPPAKKLTTKSGILVNFNEDVLYGEGEDSHVANMAQVFGTVVKYPSVLYYNTEDVERSMGWKCEMELCEGDLVWFPPLMAKNCVEILAEDKVYKVIHYQDLIVAKRKNVVIPLNGNVILEPVKKEKISSLDITDEIDTLRGIVRWVGQPNEEYLYPQVTDTTGLKDGDEVWIERGAFPYYLERSKFNAHFDQDKQYFVVQARHCVAVI